MHKNMLFRGCTRPAMFMGVPYLPFLVGAGSCLLLAFYVNFLALLLAAPVLFVMRQMARRDEMVFRLLGLRWRFKVLAGIGRTTEACGYLRRISIATTRAGIPNVSRETAISEFVPFSTHVSPSVLKTTGGDYLLTWRLGGLPFVGRDEWEIEHRQRHSIDCLQTLRAPDFANLAFWVHDVRRRRRIGGTARFGQAFNQALSDRISTPCPRKS